MPGIGGNASETVAAFLVDAGLAYRPSVVTASQYGVTRGQLPSTVQDSWIAVGDVGGDVQGKIQRTGESVTYPRVQILVRNRDYDLAGDKCREIAEALSEVAGVEVNCLNAVQVFLYGCMIVQPPTFLYEEEQNHCQIWVTVIQLSVSEVPVP